MEDTNRINFFYVFHLLSLIQSKMIKNVEEILKLSVENIPSTLNGAKFIAL